MLQGLIFLGVVLLVVGPIHWYLWRRLIKDTTTPGRARKVATIAFLALPTALLAAFLVPRIFGTENSYLISLVGYMWLAVLFYLLLILLALELPRLVVLRALTRRAATPDPLAAEATLAPEPAMAMAMNAAGGKGSSRDLKEAPITVPPPENGGGGVGRRLLLARGTAIFAGLTASSIVGFGVKTALGPPVLKRVRIPLARLPRSMDGYKIALVSDIHLGPLTGLKHSNRIVEEINGMDADLVAIVGDLVDGGVAELGSQAAPLGRLRGKDGAFFVTGNHEYYSGVDEWTTELDRLGITVLRNERVEIRGLDVAGVDDITGEQFNGGPDFGKALDDRDQSKPVVLLAHQPILAHEAARYKVDLQLSGHTHGGQMVPFNYVAALQQPVISGLGEVDGTKVYVTNGAGFWGPPVRVGAPPDITLVELRTG